MIQLLLEQDYAWIRGEWKKQLVGRLRIFAGSSIKYSDLQLALAAYNAGHANVIKFGGVPPFPETTQYVSRIMQRYDMLQLN